MHGTGRCRTTNLALRRPGSHDRSEGNHGRLSAELRFLRASAAAEHGCIWHSRAMSNADRPDGTSTSTSTAKPDGFPGQRLARLPRTTVVNALSSPITDQLLVTDAGYFPKAHRHDMVRRRSEQHIIIVCAQGSGQVTLAREMHPVGAGEVFVVPAGMPHAYGADTEDPWTIWWLHLTGKASDLVVSQLRATPQQPVFRTTEVPRLAGLVDSILRRMATDETASSLVATTGLAWHLLTDLIANGRPLARSERHDPMPEVLSHLQSHLHERVSVQHLAALAGWSPSHFSAMFRRATGFGVVEYQTRQRMGQARVLLDTTDRTIASIAAEVGFTDSLYFSRQFRRIHQLSPTQYRSRNAR